MWRGLATSVQQRLIQDVSRAASVVLRRMQDVLAWICRVKVRPTEDLKLRLVKRPAVLCLTHFASIAFMIVAATQRGTLNISCLNFEACQV